ncbi:twin-arginine translocation signal domain-containing protein [Nitrogeniibacter mangrovi]|uniref:Twin-arginine translocation signal domain-containing protein n=1 Tax=Nitrogeniibacter mangrovi TaxID=2016596 RepID=A0A6C1B0Q3_9RHOO|nr:TRAP transporter substrate-binding protein DctP [Nitrogeniibacter mangrovi]QID16569.1 twin-arginine translocation signal domain-containing protein [Nitrogeniibacter mangrovi]
MSKTTTQHAQSVDTAGNRRGFLKKTAIIGGAAITGAPFIGNAEAAKGKTWKVQSTWDAGTTGYALFEEWCHGFKEASGGELSIQPFGAKAVAADNNALFESVRTGVLDGMNPFTLYWSGKMPASVFLSSYPVGPDQPAQWDTMFYGLGLLEMTRKIYAKFGLVYVGPIQHDANIIHSKKPVTSVADFKGLKLRVPGGMVSEVFQEFGASTVSLPGSDIFPALEKGTIDAADYVGPAVNWDLGFAQVTKYILFGPPGLMSVYQPVDLMDLTVNMRAWKGLSPQMQRLVEDRVKTYSVKHYVSIQKRNVEALVKFEKAGSVINRLSEADLQAFRKAAIPIWFKWAKKDADATAVFKLQLDYMMNPIMGYVDAADIKGLSL